MLSKNWLNNCIFVISLFLFIGCSSSNKTATYTQPINFDSSSYINPEDYGYDSTGGDKENLIDSTFVPIQFNVLRLQKEVNYPEKAIRNGIEGKVILEVYIDSTGSLKNLRVVKSPNQLLTNAAIKAAIQANYKPAELNGKPANSFARIPTIFKIGSTIN